MANPQTENGYIRIANEIWDEVIRRDFSKRQKDILFFIWRLSYGCRKRAAFIPKLVYFELCGIGKNHIKEELIFLQQSKVLIWDQEAKMFEVNKDYEQWQVSPVKGWKEYRFDEILALNLEESSQNGNKKVPETGTKKFPKQELFEQEESEEFPKQELSSSQNGNYFSEKVPKTGTATASDPYSHAASEAPKDIIKDIIKNSSSSNKVIPLRPEPGSGSSPDFSFSRIYQIYERHFTRDGRVTEFEVEELGVLFDDFGGEWMYKAMREASLHKILTLAYVKGILDGFKKRGGPNKDSPPPAAGTSSLKEYQVDDDDPITQRMRKESARQLEQCTNV